MAAHFATVTARIEHAAKRGLEKAAKDVEKEAKSRIGHYQTGWKQLAEDTQADRVKHGYSADEPLLRDGKLRDSIHGEVRGLEAVVGSTEMEAVWQELGTPTIPPRPLLGPSAALLGRGSARKIGEEAVEAIIGPGRILRSMIERTTEE
jgi:hypothetical protein